MSAPLISIVLCTYNGEKYLQQQLNTLFAQTYPNLEFIFSDDCSTDNTINILNNYKNDSRVKIFKQTNNLGYVKNFEWALQQATGNFISLCDQDDIWELDKIQQLYNAIGNNLLVCSNSVFINHNGDVLKEKLSDYYILQTNNCSAAFIYGNCVWGHTILIKKNLLKHCLPIPNGITHDIWMGAIAASYGGVKYLNKVLSYYRQHNNNTTKAVLQLEASNKKRRTFERRYKDYQKILHWLQNFSNRCHQSEQNFYKKMAALYAKKQRGFFVWSLFFFLVYHHKKLYLFKNKNLLSKVLEFRKQARGEKLI